MLHPCTVSGTDLTDVAKDEEKTTQRHTEKLASGELGSLIESAAPQQLSVFIVYT